VVVGSQCEPVVREAEAHGRAVGQGHLVAGYPEIPCRCLTSRVLEFDLLARGGDGVAVQVVPEPVDGVAHLCRMRRKDERGEVGQLGVQRELVAYCGPVGEFGAGAGPGGPAGRRGLVRVVGGAAGQTDGSSAGNQTGTEEKASSAQGFHSRTITTE